MFGRFDKVGLLLIIFLKLEIDYIHQYFSLEFPTTKSTRSKIDSIRMRLLNRENGCTGLALVDILTCNGPITLLNVFRSKETHLRGVKEVTVA